MLTIPSDADELWDCLVVPSNAEEVAAQETEVSLEAELAYLEGRGADPCSKSG